MHVTFCFCSPRWPRPLFLYLFILDFEVNGRPRFISPFSSHFTFIVFLYFLRLSFSEEPPSRTRGATSAPRVFFLFFLIFLLPSTYSHNEDSLDNFLYISSLRPLKRIA